MIENIEERKEQLRELRAMPLDQKVQTTVAKILEFYSKTNKQCYVSCSGGADSMVLYDIANRMYENGIIPTPIKVVFDDTGLEEPTVRATALAIPNVEVVKPEMSFYQVLLNKGYPIISKEVSECVNNARKHFVGGGYEAHYRKLAGIGEYATKGKKDNGNINQKEYP